VDATLWAGSGSFGQETGKAGAEEAGGAGAEEAGKEKAGEEDR